MTNSLFYLALQKTHMVNMELVKLLFIVSVSVSISSAFELTKVSPETVKTVKEGGSVTLSCTVDGYYEWCTFVHNSKKCDYEWKKDKWNVTVLDCSDFGDRVRYAGNYDNYNCAMEIKNVLPEGTKHFTLVGKILTQH